MKKPDFPRNIFTEMFGDKGEDFVNELCEKYENSEDHKEAMRCVLKTVVHSGTAWESTHAETLEMIKRHFLDGVSYAELAREKGVTTNAISQRVRRDTNILGRMYRDELIYGFEGCEAVVAKRREEAHERYMKWKAENEL